MLRIAFVLVLCLAAGYAEENVKNATAEGRYSPVQNDFQGHHGHHHGHHQIPPFYGGFDFGIYGYGRQHDTLINTHVCSIDASYAVYSYPHKRHRRPHILDCSDTFFGAYYAADAKNYGYTQKGCDRCCKKAARLDNMNESEILGMMLVRGKKAKCACCAPYRPYMDLVGVPVRYQVPQYQSQPSYGQPTYPSNDQPTSY